MEYKTSTNGKILRAGGSDDPRYRVLCLPGGLCTAVFYDDVLATPALTAGAVLGDGEGLGGPCCDLVTRRCVRTTGPSRPDLAG